MPTATLSQCHVSVPLAVSSYTPLGEGVSINMSFFRGPKLGVLIGVIAGFALLVITKGVENIQEPGRQAVFNCKYTCSSLDYKYVEVSFTPNGTFCECAKETQVIRLQD
jgi:hypothetical protein